MILASQGSLAGLELLAARGSMRPNGSINNSVYVNPFDPATKRKAIGRTVKGSPKHRMKLSSRSRSNDLSELDLSSKGNSLDNLEHQNKRNKSRKSQVIYVSCIVTFNYSSFIFFFKIFVLVAECYTKWVSYTWGQEYVLRLFKQVSESFL